MPGVQRATWGIAVRSLARDEHLFDLNPQTLMVPASVAKLVSVATAVDAVGWDYRFTTTLRSTGSIEGGVLHGDLLVVGGGDPAIGGRGGDDFSTWIDALKTAGIHRIDGRVIGIDDAFEEPRPGFAWSWDDLGYSTGAIFGALNLAENRLTVTVTPGAVAGAPTSLAYNVDAQDLPIIEPQRDRRGGHRAARVAGDAARRDEVDDRRLCAGWRNAGHVARLRGQSDCVVRAGAAPASDRIGHRGERACR